MNNLEVIIGIEIHLELNTKTKMFSASLNDFKAKPNSNVSPIDIGYPGALPIVNKAAIIKGIKLAKALKMKIDSLVRFDRKNYFYPDLPKGYQITQQSNPIGLNGSILINVLNNNKLISIERIHLEEDTARSNHKGNKTLLDYGRAGVPLIEIVSNPVITSGKEAAAYIRLIREIAIALNISDAKMEEGSLRADINISLRPKGQQKFGTKVEIKNINSLSNVEKAIEFEIKEQTKQIVIGQKIIQTTKRFDEVTQKNIVMRTKGNAVDYRYFPEPNIPPIQLSDQFIEQIKLTELPWDTRKRFSEIGIKLEYIEQMVSDPNIRTFFDSIKYHNKAKLSKIFFSSLQEIANSLHTTIDKLGINPNEVTIALTKHDDGEISSKHLKDIFPKLVANKFTVEQIIDQENMKQLSSEQDIEKFINLIIDKNKGFIEQNKDRQERVVKFIIGQLMKLSKGQANPIIATRLVKKILGV